MARKGADRSKGETARDGWSAGALLQASPKSAPKKPEPIPIAYRLHTRTREREEKGEPLQQHALLALW